MAISGVWIFDKSDNKFKFQPYSKNYRDVDDVVVNPWNRHLKIILENIPITIQDVKNEVCKTVDGDFRVLFNEMRKSADIDTFLKYLIIYFDQFLKSVEFILIRRDQLADSQERMMRNMKAVEVEVKVSEILRHKRLLLGREFSKILTGEVYVSRLFQNVNSNGIRAFEALLKFCSKFIFISFHRRARKMIDYEIQRLFRSNHFIKEPETENKFTYLEKQILYGVNEPKERCCFHATSPTTTEILKTSSTNKELLWIGETKYMGPSEYLWNLEKPYITSLTQLQAMDDNKGILGHPKRLYDKNLNRDMEQIRHEKFDKEFDTYGLARRQFLAIPRYELSLEGNKKIFPLFQMKHT